MDQQREQRGANHDTRRPRADRTQNSVDDRIERARVGDGAEVQNREHEHADDRRKTLEPVDHELAGLKAEAADERRRNRHDDERHQRRHAFRQNRAEQHDDGSEPQ